MARPIKDPLFDDFRRWLRTSRGVTGRSASHYATVVRRILRTVDPLTTENLGGYVSTLPSTHRTMTRACWRAWVEWTDRCRGVTFPNLPTPVTEDNVLPALLRRAVGSIPPEAMARLTWDTDARMADLMLVRRGARGVWFRSGSGHGGQTHYSLTPEVADALRAWGYPDRAPGKTDPLVPTVPGGPDPMPPRAIRHLLGCATVPARLLPEAPSPVPEPPLPEPPVPPVPRGPIFPEPLPEALAAAESEHSELPEAVATDPDDE